MGAASSLPRLFGALAAPLVLACGGGDLLLPGSSTAAELRIVSGDGQEALTGAPLPEPLVVEAVDASERPVPGARIHFRFAGTFGGGRVDPDTARTAESGRAAAQVRLGDAAGGQVVEALLVDAPPDLRARFVLRAVAPDPGGGGGGGGGGDGGGDGDGGGGGGENDGDDGDERGGSGGGDGGDGGGGRSGDGGGGGGGDDDDDDDGDDRSGRGGGGDEGRDDDDQDDGGRDDDDGDDDDREDEDGERGSGEEKGKDKGKGKDKDKDKGRGNDD